MEASEEAGDSVLRPGIRPIRDQVLVRQDEPTEMVGRERLIIAPQGSETYPNFGTVLAVGPGMTLASGVLLTPDVAVGDRVMFLRRPDTALVPDPREGDPRGWKNLLMLREEHIIGVITEETAS